MNLFCADSAQAQLVLLELAKWRKKKTCSGKAAADSLCAGRVERILLYKYITLSYIIMKTGSHVGVVRHKE